MLEAWSVAVRISLINGVSAGLLGMVKQFGHADAAAMGLQRRIHGIQKTMLTAGILTGAGIGLLAMFKPALEQAKQFQEESAKFTLYGMGDKANAEAVKYAKGMNIMGTSSVQAMKLITEAQGVFRESGALNLQQQLVGAKIAAPVLAKLNFIESALSGDKRVAAHAQDLAMLRFIESRGGANDPGQFAKIADWGFKLSKSSGGIVDWSQLQQLMATSGAAGFSLTQDAITKLEPVIADMKGGRTGSGLRVSFQRLLGTQRGLPKQAVSEYLSLGLWDRAKVELSSGGGIKRFLGSPGAVLKDREKLATDPVRFYLENFIPAITKKYGGEILGDSARAKTERAAEISMVFGPGTAGAVYSQIDKLLPAIARSMAAQGKQLGIDQSVSVVGKTLSGKELQLHARFNTLLEQTGEVVLPLVVQGLETVLPLLTRFSTWAQTHPTIFGGLVKSVLGLGAALVVSGIVTGLSGLAGVVGLVGKVFGTGTLLKAAMFAETFPLIGAAVSKGLLAVGAFLERGLIGAVLAPIGAFAGLLGGWAIPIVAAVAAIGGAVYFIAKDWDSSKGVFGNIMTGLQDFWSHLVGWARNIPLIGNLIPRDWGQPPQLGKPQPHGAQGQKEPVHAGFGPTQIGMVAGSLLLIGPAVNGLKMVFGALGAGARVLGTVAPLLVTGARLITVPLIGLASALGWWAIPIAAAAAAIGGAIYFVVKDWDRSRSVFDNIKVGLADFWSFLVDLVRKIPLIGGLIPKAHPGVPQPAHPAPLTAARPTPAASAIPQSQPGPSNVAQPPPRVPALTVTGPPAAPQGPRGSVIPMARPAALPARDPPGRLQTLPHYGENAFHFGKAWTALSSSFSREFGKEVDGLNKGLTTVWTSAQAGMRNALAGSLNWIAGQVPSWRAAWSVFEAAVMAPIHWIGAQGPVWTKAWASFEAALVAPINWIADKARWLHDRLEWLLGSKPKAPAPKTPVISAAQGPKRDFWGLFGADLAHRLSDGMGLTAWQRIFSSLGNDQKRSAADLTKSNHALVDAMGNLARSMGAQPGKKPVEYVRPPQPHTTINHIEVKLGNKTLEKHTIRTVTRALTGPAKGSSSFDPTAVMGQVGSRYAT